MSRLHARGTHDAAVPYVAVDRENSGPVHLYYEDHGRGRPVVLIHGWPLSGASWERQVPVLLDAGYRVVAYDRRGFGRSARPGFGYDYDTFARDLAKLMFALDLRDAALVGFSMGTGEVARYLSSYGSERVRRAAFLSSLPPFLLRTIDNPGGVDGRVFERIMRRISRDRLAYLSSFLADFYNVDVFRGDRVSDEVVRFAWQVAADASAQGEVDCISAWLTDFRDDLPQVDVPSLVVHGDADRILPIDATGIPLHHSLAGSRLVVVEGAPHGLTWTHAERVNPALVDFLKA
jgi:non-heme chloroperoxidase